MSKLHLKDLKKLLNIDCSMSYGIEGWRAEFTKNHQPLYLFDSNALCAADDNPSIALKLLCQQAQGQICTYGGGVSNPHGESVTFPDIIDDGL